MKCTRPRKVYLSDPSGYKCYKVPLLVPCGKCLACRINKKREWKQRILHEFHTSENAYFVSLTYDEEHLPFNSYGVPSVSKDDVQKFFKRLRKEYPSSKIRYFLNSEYGELGRPHYHAIIFNFPEDALRPCKDFVKGDPLFVKGKVGKSMCNRHLNDIWQKGFCTIGYVTPGRCGYTADYYVQKSSAPDMADPNFNLMSRNPGIGVDYCEASKPKSRTIVHGLMNERGTYVRLPRLYKHHTYTPDEIKAATQALFDRLDSRKAIKAQEDDLYIRQVRSKDLEEQFEQQVKFNGNKKLL